MGRKRDQNFDRRDSDPQICELFGRLDALHHAATGGRLTRSGRTLETVEGLLCAYGMCATEEAWAWWICEPDYGRDCADPLSYFADRDVFEDINALAIAGEARARLAARSRELRAAEGDGEGVEGGRGSK